ncbi:MAG TPA: tRNA uridine-5-carboxymethylaminomethyl(34) synthesis GTPase MnmE, partial [Chitinophagaceae bacterium]
LIDTAGIRQHTNDLIEAAGVERSLEKMKQANLVLYLFDVSDKKQEIGNLRSEIEKHQLNYLLVGNKIDQFGEEAAKLKFADNDRVVFIAARQGLHTEVLKERMVDAVLLGEVKSESTIITNARHYHALKEMERSLVDIKNGLDNKLPGDLLALDIRRCLHYLGEITGEVNNEDMLDYIFSKFCIGK